MLIINFAHPLTEENIAEIEALTKISVHNMRDVPSLINPDRPLTPQIEAMLDSLGLTAQEWQTKPLLINPPSLSVSTAALLALLHGRIGHFPPVLRLRPDADGPVTRFAVAEIINLQALRDQARGKR